MAGLGLVIITLTSALAAVSALASASVVYIQPVHGPSTPRPAYAVTAGVREHRHGP